MRKSVLAILFADVLLLALVPLLLQLGPPSQFHVMAQSSFPDPANEHACPSQTGAGGGAEAIPAFVGPGSDGFSPNQSLCLPQLAPVPTGASPLAFIVKGVEPGDRVDSQGTVYVESIRGVHGGIDLWRWNQSIDGAPNSNGTLPFNNQAQRYNTGVLTYTGGRGGAMDSATLPAAGSLMPTDSGNTAAQIKVDQSVCPSRGNLYAAFVAPDNVTENANTGPQRSVYVGV